MPIILASWEADIWRITVQGQLEKEFSKTMSQQKKTGLGMVSHTYYLSYFEKHK
jgi:hypothetical protein